MLIFVIQHCFQRTTHQLVGLHFIIVLCDLIQHTSLCMNSRNNQKDSAFGCSFQGFVYKFTNRKEEYGVNRMFEEISQR